MTGVGQSHSSPEWVEQAPLSGSSGTEGVPDDRGGSVPQRCTIECARHGRACLMTGVRRSHSAALSSARPLHQMRKNNANPLVTLKKAHQMCKDLKRHEMHLRRAGTWKADPRFACEGRAARRACQRYQRSGSRAKQKIMSGLQTRYPI